MLHSLWHVLQSLWSNSRYSFFYIFIHSNSFLKILPNFNLLRTLELTFFGILFPRISVAALRDSRKKNWDGALKAKMCPFGRRGKLLVKRTSFNGQPNTLAFCLFEWIKNMLSKDSVFNFIAVNFVVPTFVVKIAVCVVVKN